jgi:hypothetical protein
MAANGKRVKEILSWYSADNPGTLNSLARMLNHGRLGGTGKMVILPVDQGFEHGPARSFAPNPAGYDPRYHYELAIDAAATPTPRRSGSWRPAPPSTPAGCRRS